MFAALALLPLRARALGGAVAPAEGAIVTAVDYTNKAVVQGSDEKVYGSGVALQQLVGGGSTIRFHSSFHPSPRPQLDGREAGLGDLLDEGRKRLDENPSGASQALRENVLRQAALSGQGRVGFDRGLSDNEMGVYRFSKGKASEGRVDLNPWLKELSRVVGWSFAAATLVHEAGHAGDAAIDQEGVIDGEVPAFQIQYQWLCFVDPTGHLLAGLRQILDAQQHAHPTKLGQMAVDYAATLDVLRGTGGDPKKIKAFADQLGYREGQGKTAVALPNS
jgi:hypothetical protein